MADSLVIEHLELPLSVLAAKPTHTNVEVLSVQPRKKYDKTTNSYSDEIEGYNLTFVGKKSGAQTCKLPLECAEVIERIDVLLKCGNDVRVNFGTPDTLIGKFSRKYGRIFATAETVVITAPNSEFDDFDGVIE